MDACRRHSSGRTTSPGSDSEPHTDDRRKLQALDPTSHSDRAGSQRQQPSSGLDRSRRSGTGQPRDRARMTPDTTNNSETLRQIAIKATDEGATKRIDRGNSTQTGADRVGSPLERPGLSSSTRGTDSISRLNNQQHQVLPHRGLHWISEDETTVKTPHLKPDPPTPSSDPTP